MKNFTQKIARGVVRLKSLLRKIKYRLSANLTIDSSSMIKKGVVIETQPNSKITIINSAIDHSAKIIAGAGGEIIIKDSYIGSNCVIVARDKIVINSHCQIAEMVVIRDQFHNFGEKGKTIEEQGFSSAPIIINENVWVGAKASILKGVNIGKNAVIGAHSLVNKSVEADSIYVGSPAKKIKSF